MRAARPVRPPLPQRPEEGEYRSDIIEHTLHTMRTAGYEPDLDHRADQAHADAPSA
ncbi:hypothetical protein [Streptomyces antimicrobicus]|uniref:Uncharacterized protein n=1 Tax=Streptomyces antimicrobicus TaxID=2883108 RepID=A0ABS8B7H7_9ACTN|nr:hypothetical protein [Streptomyces antimicrobicus]MCB5180557.1 hypothetical protein [Streptomyces antimicrobicus]